ncbi:MAG: hypothetical protein HDR20_02755 [Lachnospiraceae bacterium]|nr:hypothetical protein [Lachnospiraceae bacterium]
MDIKEFINAVQNRPLMYVEEIRMDYIYYLVIGYLGSNLVNKRDYCADLEFKRCFDNWLLEWVRKNVDKNYECHGFIWYKILIDVTKSEKEAVELFFNLSTKFFLEMGL